MIYERGSVYYVDFGKYDRGSEQGGIRPAVAISNNIGNKNAPIVTFAPITSSSTKNKIPTHIELDDYRFLDNKSIILMEQIITKDKRFIKEKIGRLNDNDLFKLDYYAGISLELFNNSSCNLKKSLLKKVDNLKELKGYINRHVMKFNETESIKDDIIEYNNLFLDFKNICIDNKIYYKLLYNGPIAIEIKKEL